MITCRYTPGTAGTTSRTLPRCAGATTGNDLIQVDGLALNRSAGGVAEMREQRVYASDVVGLPAENHHFVIFHGRRVVDVHAAQDAVSVGYHAVAGDQRIAQVGDAHRGYDDPHSA